MRPWQAAVSLPDTVFLNMAYSLKTLDSPAGRPPATLARVSQELLLLAGAVALAFAVLALTTYSPQDAAWSTSGAGGPARNAGGKLGAWLADLSYVLLGFSAWWCVAAGLRAWLSGVAAWMRGAPQPAPARGFWRRLLPRRVGFWLGLGLLLLASSCLEWMRLYQWDGLLPGKAGGALGALGGPLATQWLGPVGSTLLGVAGVMVGAALALDFSWGRMAERVGALVCALGRAFGSHLARLQDGYVGYRAARQRHDLHKTADVPPAADAPPPAAQAPAARRVEPQVIELPAATPAPASAAAPAESAILRDAAGPVETVEPRPARESREATPERDTFAAFAARHEPTLDDLPPFDPDEPPGPALADAFAVRPAGPAITAPAPLQPSERVAKERQKPLFADIPDSPLPQVSLLDVAPVQSENMGADALEMTSRLIEKKLKDFGVQVHVVHASPGPVITRYEIEPATGVKGAQVVNLAKDLARSLSLVSIRVVETIPGKNYMALELPNAKRQTIHLSEILGSQVYHEAKSLLTVGLGKDIIGNPVVADLAKMPHVLVAGTTGSGKSVGINAMILSLLYKAEPKDVRLLMVDPKMLEMSVYEGIPHLLCPVVTDMKQAAHGLNWCVAEMERRYKLMSKAGVRNLAGFNKKIDEARAQGQFIYNPFSLTPDDPEPLERLPHIVVVIDELADLMMVVGKKIEELIARLAQKARAAGIHLILATQRPSVDVITGLIKANIPTRIAFQVSSKIDSRTILDQMGAETLLGMGDMLYLPAGVGLPQRVHGAFVSDDEVHRVVEYLKSQGEPNYIEGVLEGGVADGEDSGSASYSGEGFGGGDEQDAMYDRAVEFVLTQRKATISALQRALRIGYGRSARLLDSMEAAGLVSPMDERNNRTILAPPRD